MYEQPEQEALNAGMEAPLQLLKQVPPRGMFSPNCETRLVNVLQHPHKLLSAAHYLGSWFSVRPDRAL